MYTVSATDDEIFTGDVISMTVDSASMEGHFLFDPTSGLRLEFAQYLYSLLEAYR
jgi:hypothetical protein